MEELKSSNRPFKMSNASVRSLSGDCDYYRVRLNSRFKSSGNNVEAVYNINQLFPNNRANLMDGEWYAYLEEFVLRGYSQWGRINIPTGGDTTSHGIRVCLPDLVKPSKDFVVTATGMHPDDTLALVPKTIEPNTQPHKVFDATIASDGNQNVTVTFQNAIGELFNDGDQVAIFGLSLAANDLNPQIDAATATAINNYVNRWDLSIDTIGADGASFAFDPAGPVGAGQAANAVGDLVGAYDAGWSQLAGQAVKVAISVRNGVTLNTDPPLPASIEANDNPYEPVYRLKQGDTSVGHAINPGSLFSGQLKVALKGDDHKLVTDPYFNEPDTLTNIYGYDVDYDATVVFVHKKKSMHY